MKEKDEKIEINFLDHVAIRVRDIELSVQWYEKVLGLKKFSTPKWGAFPVMMLANKSGIAIFPAHTSDTAHDPDSKNVSIDHFAFNVNKENFERAKKRYTRLNLEFSCRDHSYFHSIYTKDPDGHTVELTTLVVDEKLIYD